MIAPATLGQERIWLQDLLNPGDCSYNMFFVRRLRGELDVDALAQAIDDVVSRHEPLRTTFASDETGAVRQYVHAAIRVPVDVVEVAPDRAHAEVGRRTNAPFDLAAGPLLRVSLLRLDCEDHVLVIVVHHIACDGWSMNVLLHELASCYRAHRDGVPVALAPMRVSYTQWATQQRSAGIDQAAQEYWREALDGVTELRLPTDRTGESGTTGAYLAHRLPLDLTERVEQLARSARCSLFMALTAAYQALLFRYTGQDDLCIGTFTAGRDEVATEPLIGYFLNTLVLRADLSGDPTMRELLSRTRTAALGAYAHPRIPFEELLGSLTSVRDPSRPTLFRTTLVLQNPDTAALSLPGLVIEPFDDAHTHSKMDLAVEVWREPDGLTLYFGYRTGLFSEAAVARLAYQVEAVLRQAVADPDTRVSALDLLRPGERDLLLRWGTGAESGSVSETVLDLIDTRSDAVAVRQGSRTLSYAELASRSTALAARLRETGVQPGSTVGVCLEPCVDLIVAMLAVWRAGAAYVPLDPGYPAARLDYLVGDSGVRIVVGATDLRDRLPASVHLQDPGSVTRQDPDKIRDDARILGQDPCSFPDPAGILDATAYVIYTSGSTGQPKGVRVGHRALAARVRWMRDHYGLTHRDSVLQFASPSFDTHAEEIFPALIAGATMVLREQPAALLPEILGTDAGSALTVLDLPTAYWHEVAGQSTSWPPGLRLLILGADQVDATALHRWYAHHGDAVRLINTYGPTEATIVATSHDLSSADAERIVPIGTPLAGVRAYVLDDGLRVVPVGLPGELYLSGAGLADGYHRRAGLTADRFVPDPLAASGERMYRTGDRARWNDDGTLTFLGRTDDQVKIRGYRIEPGEVRTRLLTAPQVNQAAVVARTVTAGDRQLVAYLVPPTVSIPEVRDHLARTVPAYMVPTQWVTLDRLPLTANGKVDVRALPDPVAHRPAGTVYIPPRTPAEDLVAQVWCEVLGVQRAGAEDDFFALGGHSLLATRVATRLSCASEVDIPLRMLFTHRILADVAVAVEDLIRADLDRLTEEEALALLGDAA